MSTDRYAYDVVPSPQETAAFERLIRVSKRQMQRDYPNGTMRRDAHAKNLGLVHGTLTIEDNLPDHLRVGVFSQAQTFPCWVRFSNSGGVGGVHPDKKPDVRGLGIKIFGVEGRKILKGDEDAVTHDFLFISSPTFMVKDAIDFSYLVQALGAGGLDRLFKLAAFFFNPLNLRLRELRLLIKLQVKMTHLLGHQWWSATPYRLGEQQAAKYTLIPRTPVDTSMPADPAPDFLRQRLQTHLQTDAAEFDFCVQVAVDEARTPIYDTRQEWPTHIAPFTKVATLRIPPQTFGSDAQRTYAENLRFTPWHALPEHAPLGSINRARQEVYGALSHFRYEVNGVTLTEPTERVSFE